MAYEVKVLRLFNAFLYALRVCCECTERFSSRGDSVPFMITCQALSCTQVVGAGAHPGPWVRFPGEKSTSVPSQLSFNRKRRNILWQTSSKPHELNINTI